MTAEAARSAPLRSRARGVRTAATLTVLAAAVFVGARWLAETGIASEVCGTRTADPIAAHELGAFQQINDGVLSGLPLKGLLPGSSAHPDYVTEFQLGRTRGFLALLALTPEARALERPREEALGYPAGELPLVPLEGAIVAANPGLLEVYQTTVVFRSTTPAEHWIALRAGQLEGTTRLAASAVQGADEAYTSGYLLGPNDGEHEYVRRLFVRVGKIVTDLSFQAGSTFEVEAATAIAGPSILRLRSCGAGT